MVVLSPLSPRLSQRRGPRPGTRGPAVQLGADALNGMQADGWILRNAIIWHKPNAMPESVRDRLNCRHELVFLLVKSLAYWFDLDPIREPHKTVKTREPGNARRRTRPPSRPSSCARPPKYGPGTREIAMASRYGSSSRHRHGHPNGRNPGDVWSIPTHPYHGPHFAAYPIDPPLRCIAAGCKPGGTVLDPFADSGTTGLAAIQLGRRFTGINLSPNFVRLAAQNLLVPSRHAHPQGESHSQMEGGHVPRDGV